ncbi:HNH endonuclease signature motif containing protein [Rothia sp. LK2588]|uniref:HNH endonuclease signature motif containing protein n=1 Tax=Rothia sp. LK2588 TaxID=3114369 RepID=UPI0034CF9A58
MGSERIRNGRGHRSFRRQREILKRRGLPCAWCGKPIDYSAPPNDPLAFTADHVIPIAGGGSLHKGELQPMHRMCNAKKGSSMPVRIRQAS